MALTYCGVENETFSLQKDLISQAKERERWAF